MTEKGDKAKARLDELSEAEEEVAMLDKEKGDPEKPVKGEDEEDDPNKGFWFYMLDNHLWMFAIWLVPISLGYDIFWWFRARINWWMCGRHATRRHEDKVEFAKTVLT